MTRYRSVLNVIFMLIIPAQISPLYANNAVPVLIWGGAGSDSERHSTNPFTITPRKEFESFLHEKLEDLPPVVFFVTHNLCVEDLTKHKQLLHWIVTGDSYYYFPAVESAVNVIEDLPSFSTIYGKYSNATSKVQLMYTPISSLDFVQEIYDTLKETSPNLTAILTGMVCSYGQSNRVKREANNNVTGPLTVITGRALLYASEPLQLKIPEVDNVIELPLSFTEKDIVGDDELTLNLQFAAESEIVKHALSFKFENKSGYYYLKTVNYKYTMKNNGSSTNHSLTPNTDIVFPSKFSYHCSHNLVFKENDSYFLTIKDFQVQLFNNEDSSREARFGSTYDCVGFMTIPIWTGIFVATILSFIMIWGITMLMDIRIMDRFDDPKGKMIMVSTLE
ncbi:uncharacterized protein LOC143219272 [Lasioglossum baleicum]|uniref:uncharacterized protein LOC143219272 n=1 Tax=Lasioglossum baleicum TaxID=434251 RepID=UPI003FCEB842